MTKKELAILISTINVGVQSLECSQYHANLFHILVTSNEIKIHKNKIILICVNDYVCLAVINNFPAVNQTEYKH